MKPTGYDAPIIPITTDSKTASERLKLLEQLRKEVDGLKGGEQ